MEKEKSLMDLKLSDLIEKSLAMGVLPVFQFIDKDNVEVSEVDQKSVPISEQTPVDVLQKEIRFYERTIIRLEKMSGIDTTAEERVKELVVKLKDKIIEFTAVINLLNSTPNVQGSDATEAK